MKSACLLAPLFALAVALPAAAQTSQTAPANQGSGTQGVAQDVRDVINRGLGGQQTRTQQQRGMAPTGTFLREVDDDEPLRGPNNLTVRQMEDAIVSDANGKRIGEVEEVIANNRDEIVGVTVEVGGFLGIRDKEVLVPIEQLTIHNGQFRTKLTADQLKALPKWDDD